jgi:hypothetical protein
MTLCNSTTWIQALGFEYLQQGLGFKFCLTLFVFMVEQYLLKCKNCSNMQFYVWTAGLEYDDAVYQCTVCDNRQLRNQNQKGANK